ncbi:Chromate transporter [Anaeromyxobacter dehalogenans 2CP-C]|uniref:Chromate transporter n=1 Tax=Anaeromyxobacter dehalogenans (strain 2CP-C) TaxID=290397 RepID=Q2IN29_ANADE|nr:Chromate transporter [Anaeromyxobacter dehalogenans 2CP-C]
MPLSRRPRPTLPALARASAWLGLTGFGGGLSVLGTMHDLLVERRRWLTEREFTVTATVSQMLPGGAAANALAYTGLRFHGPAGAIAAYAAFIAPGAIVVTLLAALYVRLGVTPTAAPLLAGLNAAVVGIVASITLQMLRAGVQRAWQMGVAAATLLFSLGAAASAGEMAALGIGAGLVLDLGVKRMRLLRFQRRARRPSPPVALPDEGTPLPPPVREGEDEAPADPAGPPRLPALALLSAPALGALGAMALLFLRAGLGAYGGGFAIIPHLQASVLAEHWIGPRQFADAVAIGKLTPGPVLLMATFIGYLVHGIAGAAVATAAVFAGPLALVLAVGAWLARVRSRRPVRAALRGLTPAVVGLMAAAALALGRSLEGRVELAIAAASLLTLARFRVNPVLVMALGGGIRLALSLAGL